MKQFKKLKTIITGMILILIFVPLSLYAQELKIEDIKIIKISPMDEKAVVQFKGTDKMEIIKVGDQVKEFGEVTMISQNSIEIVKKSGQGIEKIVISLENGKQKIYKIGGAQKETAPVEIANNEIKSIFKRATTEDEKKYPPH